MSKPLPLSIHRSMRAMTVADLAKRAGVSDKTIIDIEGDKTKSPHARTVLKITEALGVTPSDIREFSGMPSEEEVWHQRFDRLAGAVMLEDDVTRDRILRNAGVMDER